MTMVIGQGKLRFYEYNIYGTPLLSYFVTVIFLRISCMIISLKINVSIDIITYEALRDFFICT